MKQKNPGNSKCFKHGERLIVYCDEKECQIMLCTACIVTKHRNHNVIDIPEKAEEMRKRLAKFNEENQGAKNVFNEQIKLLREVMHDINTTASKALDELDDTRDFLYQQVKEGIEKYKSKVIEKQQNQLMEVKEAIDSIEKRRARVEQCCQLTGQVVNNDNPNDVIHNSQFIISNFKDAVKLSKHDKTRTFYETMSFLPKKHDNFQDQILGQLDTTVNKINMPNLSTRGIPLRGTLVKSWNVGGGYTVASDGEGEIYAGSYENGSYYLKSFDIDGNVKMSVDLASEGHLIGVTHTYTNGHSILALSTGDNSIQIRHSNNGQLIDSQVLGFRPGLNVICVTPDNNILVGTYPGGSSSQVIEFQVRNMKLVKTQKSFNIPYSYIRGVCHVTHDKRQLVIATSDNDKSVVAVDYHTGEVVWKIENPTFEGAIIEPMGITSDVDGHLFISDWTHKRVCIMTQDGKVHHTLLKNENAEGFYHQAWIQGQQKVVVRDYNQTLNVYDVTYEQK